MKQQNRSDKTFMKQCLALAQKGRGRVSPNPLVGAVVVRRGKVVGKGYHSKFGGPHAEAAAIRSCGRGPAGATLYVNLEPCCHYGKTPPCTDLIVASGIARVVIGLRDPNPLVSGRGVRALRRAGIAVTEGVMMEECRSLNEAFLRHVTTGLPFVTMKVAQTLDGMISDRDGNSRWITGEKARVDVHRRRSEADCVLVGAGTVADDDPLLTVRHVRGPQPVRAVLDGNFSSPGASRLFSGVRHAPTVVITTEDAFIRHRRKAARLARRGVTFMVFSGPRSGAIPPADVLSALGRRGITSVFVEGGPATWGAFLNARCVDRIVVYTSPSLLGGKQHAFGSMRPTLLDRRLLLKNVTVRAIAGDLVTEADVFHTMTME
jgi:diaminohydroxyphosphoribosylaminopyrimidine deaminase/5-amino-6-(5-phosphoribosylamino)uracil reductase